MVIVPPPFPSFSLVHVLRISHPGHRKLLTSGNRLFSKLYPTFPSLPVIGTYICLRRYPNLCENSSIMITALKSQHVAALISRI